MFSCVQQEYTGQEHLRYIATIRGDKWGKPNAKQSNLKKMRWTRSSWSESETVSGSQSTDPYSKTGRAKAQRKYFIDFICFKSLDRRIMNPNAFNALLDTIAMCGLGLTLLDNLKPRSTTSSKTRKILVPEIW